jgi:DNA gyrase subunit A
MANKIKAGSIIKKEITDEIQQSYLDYAMSVIVTRALPDVRDGLKPVARRILFSMWQQGLRSTAKFRKSANVVGDVLGKYHPHGDQSVYDALARLAQDFSLRYQLIFGQGNWGSIDGDSPAAMRYTEAKLTKLADEMMFTIEKDTVDFADNYDGTRREPTVLPSALPNFLINGTLGIAVGMATNVPPHNLGEVCSAAIELINNPKATVEDLVKHVQGPDFPTGGAIYDHKEILQVYATGKGRVVMRALAEIEEDKGKAFRIVVSKIPYLVNKAVLVTKIAEAVKTKKIEGIRDLRDETDRDGIRIVIELKKDAYPRKTLNRLFALTDLQKTFHVNMLALVDGGRQPKVLTLKEALEEHIKHRQTVVTRRTQYDLDQAKKRAHILEGLKKALDHINEVIATIKKSRTKETAHLNLRKNFKLSDAQTTAILEMRLQTLAGLERKKVEDELAEKRKLIKELQGILDDPKKILAIIKDKYQELIDNYGDPRRTRVFKQSVNSFSQEDLIPDDPTVISVTRGGYIKRLATSAYRVQHRGGKGVKGMDTKEEDIVDTFLATTTHTELLFFTNKGRVFTANAYEIPATTRAAKGKALPNFLELAANEHVTAVQALPTKNEGAEFLVMATKQGVIKKTPREAFTNIRKSGLKAINLKAKDTLDWVSTTTSKDEIMLVTANGQSIRFSEQDIRPMGRTAAGVRGMKLKANDRIVAMHVIPASLKNKYQVLVISEKGYGKRTPLTSYRLQQRGGTGIKTANITDKTGQLVRASIIEKQDLKKTDTLIITENGQVIRIPASSISQQGRATQGVKVMSPTAQSGIVATFTTWTETT